MKAVVFTEPNKLILEDRPIPAIGETDVLVRVRACGICGTDVHIYHGKHIVKFPVVPGHELAGEIADVGAEVTSLRVGDRVAVDPNIVDNTCYFCRRGEVNLCEQLRAVGVNYDGGFAEYCRVPATQAHKVPEGMTMEEAAMAEPVACCLHGIDRAEIASGSVVLVLGAGSIGLMMVQLAKSAGASRVIVSEPAEMNRRLAEQLGADIVLDPSACDVGAEVSRLTGVGVDVVIECAGRPETAALSLKTARRGGTVLQFGVVSPEKLIEVSPYDIYYRELKIIGSFVNPFTHARAIELLASKRIDVTPLVTHRFGLDEASDALGAAQGRNAVKVMIIPD